MTEKDTNVRQFVKVFILYFLFKNVLGEYEFLIFQIKRIIFFSLLFPFN